MAEPWPNYSRTPVEMWEVTQWEVYDPWSAQVLGVFNSKAEAKLFVKAFNRQAKKAARKGAK